MSTIVTHEERRARACHRFATYGDYCQDYLIGDGCNDCERIAEQRQRRFEASAKLARGEHVYVRHTACEQIHCSICDGGLSLCENCHGTEASLTTTCVGQPLGELFHSLIANDGLDYVEGRWIFIEPTYTLPAHKRLPISTEAFIAGLIASAEERIEYRRAQMAPGYFASKGDRLAIAVRPASAGT